MTQRTRAGSTLYLAWAVAGLCVVTLFCRLQGANPPSLRLDDQWLGIVARQMTVAEFLALRPPVPIGFAAAQGLVARWVPDPELSLQIIPIAASLIQLPLMALLTWRVTRSSSLAFLAAVLLSLSPTLADQAVTAKQYASDSLVTVILLLWGIRLLRNWSPRGWLLFAVVALVSLSMSFPSVFVTLSIVNIGLLWNHPSGGHARVVAFALWLAIHGLLAAVYWVWLRDQSNDAMQLYWTQHFVAFDSLAAIGYTLGNTIVSAMAGAFPVAINSAAILTLLGLVGAVAVRKYRPIGLCAGLLYAGAMLASALWVYPLGTGRTDSYLHPVTILLAMLPIKLLFDGQGLELSRSTRFRRCRAWLALSTRRRARPIAFATAIVGVLVLVVFSGPTLYEPGEDALLAQELASRVSQEDAVIIYPHAEFAMGYYTQWTKRLRPSPDYAHGFDLEFDRPNTLKLPPPNGTAEYASVVESLISNFLSRSTGRVYY